MQRQIVGFHQDDEGDWVAELVCLHNQHVRHRPPFQDRPWVLDEQTRSRRIGSELDCPLCDRAELPESLQVVRVAGPFDETSVPAGLLRAHRIAAGTWGRLVVLEGAIDFHLVADPPLEVHLSAGSSQPIPPDAEHHVRVGGPARFQIEFLRRQELAQASNLAVPEGGGT